MLLALTPAHAQTKLPPHVGSDGPTVPVIYIEQSGSLGPGAGDIKVKTCRAVCQPPVHAKPCRVDGNPAREGEYMARNWRAAEASARYSETWSLAQENADVCTLKLIMVPLLIIHSFDGTASTTININLDRGEGTRRVNKGKGLLGIDSAKGVAALRASGYAPAGTGRYAGYTCQLLRKEDGDLVQEACLLDDPNAPARAAGIAVHLMPLATSMMNKTVPEGRIHSATTQVNFDATAPAALFTPPPNIRLKDVK